MNDRWVIRVVVAFVILSLLLSRLFAAAGEPQSAWLWGVTQCRAR